MISDYDLVLAAKATYEPKATPIFECLGSSIRIFQSKINDLNVIAIEGTHNPLGWALDFFAIAAENHQAIDHPALGFLHAGFYAAATLAMPTVKTAIGQEPYAICGHSLGAAEALLMGGLLIDDGRPPVRIAAFAPPRVGGEQFVNVVKPLTNAYRYSDDPVPLVPFWTTKFPYKQVPLIEIGETSFDNGFNANSINNYVNAIENIQLIAKCHKIDNYVNSVPK